MPQKWNLSSSVKCIFRKTRENRILVKQCNVFIVNFDTQRNQKLRIVVIVTDIQRLLKSLKISQIFAN